MAISRRPFCVVVPCFDWRQACSALKGMDAHREAKAPQQTSTPSHKEHAFAAKTQFELTESRQGRRALTSRLSCLNSSASAVSHHSKRTPSAVEMTAPELAIRCKAI